jgi:putative ABC transport system permease protein
MTRMAAYADVWLPVGTLPSSEYRHGLVGGFHGLVLAKSRADFPRLKSEFNARLREFPLDRTQFTEVRSGLDTTFEAVARLLTWNRAGDRAPLIVMVVFATMALLFMTLPALNLVTINLSRILERAPEIGVRKAFGAPRRALVFQFVMENILLTLIGGVIGFLLSVIILGAIGRSDVIPNTTFDVNLRIFAWGMAIAVVFGLLSGVYPAWRMARLDPVNPLRGGAR